MTTTTETLSEIIDRLDETHSMIQAFADLLGNIDAVTEYINDGTKAALHNREAIRNILSLLTDRAKADTRRLLEIDFEGMNADGRQLRTIGT